MTPHSLLVSRRSFLGLSSVLLAPAVARADVIRADFPAHEPELVQEVVLVAHGQVARLKELVGRRPALAQVSYDGVSPTGNRRSTRPRVSGIGRSPNS